MAYVVAAMVEILEQDQHHLDLTYKNEIESLLEKARSWRDDLLVQNRLDSKLAYRSALTSNNDTEILEQDQRHLDVTYKNEIELLIQNSFDSKLALEMLHYVRKRRYRELQNHIIHMAHKIEDVIEGHISNQILQLSPPNQQEDDDDIDSQLTHLVQKFESIIQEALEIVDDDPLLPLDHLCSEVVPWYPKLDPRTKDNISSIFENDFKILKARIIEGPSKLQIIAINGNAGMGKRTLAQRLYNDPLIAKHFPTRAWVTCPPFNVNEKSCLLNLLEGLGMLTNDMRRKDVDELKLLIRNTLKKIKYFIVIHDVTERENLVTFTRLFRDYGVRARIFFTTNNINRGTLSIYAEPYQMPLLEDTESWLLLRQKVFGREHCPDDLEHIGKNIMQMCRGNPQIISLVSGVLATSKKTPETWELVATTLGNELNHESFAESMQSDLCILIYYHLPHYLRPCLLYIGAFFESRDIKASKIIKLWIAEGFVKQSADECLEDVAEKYLKILIDKNLLYRTQEEPNGGVRAFQLHVFLRVFIWPLADCEKFLGSKYYHEYFKGSEEKFMRRVSIHGSYENINEMELPSLARSFLSVSGASRRQVSIYLKLKLLRVLDVFQSQFFQFPTEIMQQVILRYLAFSCYSNLPNSFSTLRNLQSLIIRRLPGFRPFFLPSDLWGLIKLRHVKCKETFVLNYPISGKKVVHWNLQTLSNMQLFGVTNLFLTQIPNIKNLGIYCNIAMETVFDLACLEKLETLKCSSDWSLASYNFLSYLTFPRSMRKLNLSLCRIPLKFMEVVGSLPNLELLKLHKSDFISVSSKQSESVWETAEGEFPRLVSLEMLDLNLVHWRAKAAHLPRLKHLVIRNCYAMEEIPLDIGNIESLELIQVNETSPSALASAIQIQKEQEARGNKFLQIRTHKVV